MSMAGTNGLKMGNKLLEWEAIERDLPVFECGFFCAPSCFKVGRFIVASTVCMKKGLPYYGIRSNMAPTGKFKRQYCLHLFLVFIHLRSYFINFYRILINWQQTEHFHQFDGNLILWWRLPLIETNQSSPSCTCRYCINVYIIPLSHLWRDFCTSF